MGSRVRCRTGVKKLFLSYITINAPWADDAPIISSNEYLENPASVIKSIFPCSFKDQEVLRTAVQFALPCVTQSGVVEVFTFVLTSGDSKWTFGYCRHSPGLKMVTLFLSFLPWQEIFYRTLNYCAELDETTLVTFLERMYVTPVPDAGTCLYIPMTPKPFICPCPSDYSLPSIPENRNVSEFYNALGIDSMMTLFAALLSERRIIITSKKLSRFSSIVIAANLFLFPMSWQHIFIPILPESLQDYLSAPMPFLIGVPIPVWNQIPLDAVGQVVHVDADTDTVTTPFPEDISTFPDDILHTLRKNLKGEKALGDGLARAFLRALAQLMGHYQDAIREGGESFDEDLFLHYAHPSHRSYIQDKLLKLQIFHQFVEERLEKIKSGSCESDEFEFEALAWRSHSRSNGKNGLPVLKSIGSQNVALKKAGKAVMMSVKRESGHLIDSVKQNSALKSAIRSVKEGGKSVKQRGHIAYSDIKSKFHVGLPSNSPSSAQKGSEDDTQGSAYRRHTTVGSSGQAVSKAGQPAGTGLPTSLPLSVPLSSETHLMSSCSASNLPNFDNDRKAAHIDIKPRLSKSEENLIDLETPDECGFGFTLENPLYDLVTNNSVFEDIVKTDEQLLAEYGLNDYFTKLNFSSSTLYSGLGGGSRRTSGSGLSGTSNTSQQSEKWTTFE